MENSEDIISQLVNRHMNWIAENILSHLDDISLHNCESVSKTWYLVIRNGKLWKHLFQRVLHKRPFLQALHQRKKLESSHQMKADEFAFKRLLLADKNVEENWRSGTFSTQTANLGEVSVSIFVMDAKRVLFGLRSSSSVPSSILVWNRWTLEYQHVLIGHQEWITDMQLCGDLIFCSYYDGTILVWDLNSREVIQQFQDQEVVDWMVIHAAHRLLISCTSTASGPNANDRDTVIVIRRITNPLVMVIERREDIPDAKVCRLVSDENYFIVCFTTTDDGVKLQLRSTSDFQCLREISHLVSFEETFAYHGGRLVTGSPEGTIKVWDLETQTCNQTWSSHETDIKQLCLIPSYIIAKSTNGTITVWDFPAVDNTDPPEAQPMKELFKIKGQIGGIMDPSFVADKLQILTVSVKDVSHSSSISHLVIRDFLKRVS